MANPENSGRATLETVVGFRRDVIQGNPDSWSAEAQLSAGVKKSEVDMNSSTGKEFSPTETELE